MRALKNTQLLVCCDHQRAEGATRRAAPQPHLRTELTVRLSSSVGWAALACSSTSWSCSDIILYTVLYLELVLDVGLGFPLPATRLLIQRGSDDGVAARFARNVEALIGCSFRRKTTDTTKHAQSAALLLLFFDQPSTLDSRVYCTRPIETIERYGSCPVCTRLIEQLKDMIMHKVAAHAVQTADCADGSCSRCVPFHFLSVAPRPLLSRPHLRLNSECFPSGRYRSPA